VPFVDGPDGSVEVVVSGRGEPITVFAHGLASSIAETRPFGSGVDGTRVFLHFRGHGRTSSPDSRWTYSALRSELTSVVTAYGATQGLGISLGAGALLRAAWEAPERFQRLVFVLPSTIDRPRHDEAVRRMEAMADLVDRRDLPALVDSLLSEQPIGARARPDVAVWARRQAERLVGTPVGHALRDLPTQQALPSGADLSRLSMPALVVGQADDPAHPEGVARELASRLPNARLQVYDDRGLLWAHRSELRALISTFLTP
jgi:pimeloyl-ACP methyl ester carboxylesterase